MKKLNIKGGCGRTDRETLETGNALSFLALIGVSALILLWICSIMCL